MFSDDICCIIENILYANMFIFERQQALNLTLTLGRIIMSKRNDYDYFDLDNFDDSYDSREYRRRTNRGNGSYNRRPSGSYNRRRPAKRRNKRRMRNRIIIISAAVLIVAVFIFVISSVIKGCSDKAQEALATVSTSTVSKNPSPAAASASNKNAASGELAADYFVTPKIKDDNTNGEMVYNIYVWHNTGFELFSSDDARAQKYAQTINGFADSFGSTVKIYDMIVPNHTEMGLPQRIKDSSAPSTSQADNIKSAYAALSDKVIPVNCYNKLAEHNSEYIYFKSDHHWSGLGAYYAYTAFAETNKLPVLPLADCTEHKIEGFTGSFANTVSTLDSDTLSYWEFPYSVSMDIYNDDGTSTTYDSPYYQYAEPGSNTYGVFILGDNGLTVLKSSSEKAESGKKIAVVKESYGNAFVPYLTYNYDEVHVVDFRYYNGNLATYCQENNIDEVLFLNGIMSANTQIQLDSMSSLFN